MIFNKTNNSIISKNEKICSTIFSQSLGLMFKSKQNLVMIFPTERIIKLHNFFVFYPLTIVVLDKKQRIMEIKHRFKPFTFWNSAKQGKYVIELAEENNTLKVGQQLEL
ncbi:MAG: DUF192 domain-containing protein [Nanoarchaeota archaeon]